MNQKLKKHLILACLLTLLPIPVGMILAPEMPRGALIWPSVGLMMGELVAAVVTFKDPGNRGRNYKPLSLVLWIVPMVSNFCFAMTLALTKGYEFSGTAWYVPLGLMFTAMGNYFPKTKMNKTMGIKVSWAYTSEENWNATHRFGGKVWFIGGFLVAGCCLLPENIAVPVFLVLILVMCIAPTVYSWRYYKMQLARGDELNPLPSLIVRYSMGSINWSRTAVVLAIPCLIILGSVLMLFTGDIEYHIYDEYLGIEADYWGDTYMFYDTIESVEYREENVEGSRVSGFGSFRLLMGFFKNDEFGGYTRYTYYDPECAVVLTHVHGETYVLSGKNQTQTQALYQALLEKIG